MDLGIRGRTALVCAASKGLGKGCAASLAREGVRLVVVARGREALEATAAELRARHGVEVATVAADVTTEDGRRAALAACPAPDILVNNAGGPPPGDFRDWDRDAWVRALEANMIAPILLIRGVVDGMIARGFGRIVNVTSAAVKSPIPGAVDGMIARGLGRIVNVTSAAVKSPIPELGLSPGAPTGLTGSVPGL